MESTVVLSGHSSRAIEFHNKADDIYFVIGRTSSWSDELNPPTPNENTVVEEIIGYKKSSVVQMVIPNESGTLIYKGQNWKIIKYGYEFCLLESEVVLGNNTLTLKSCPNIIIENGDKVRLNKSDIYTVDSFNTNTNLLTLQENVTSTYPVDTVVEFGAIPEGCKWIYIEGELSYDELPLSSFRQVGIVTKLTKDGSIPGLGFALLPNEVLDDGILEIVENRRFINRSIDQREKLYIILEF